MDRRLLKGFYTTNRTELGNPSIIEPAMTRVASLDEESVSQKVLSEIELSQ